MNFLKVQLIIIIEKIKRIEDEGRAKEVVIFTSVDTWGPQAEYIRYGLDLNQWEQNFKKLLDLKFVRLQINLAINGLSIKYMFWNP